MSASRRSPRRSASRRATPVTGPAAKLPPNQTRLGNRPLAGGSTSPVPPSPAAPPPGAGAVPPAVPAQPAAIPVPPPPAAPPPGAGTVPPAQAAGAAIPVRSAAVDQIATSLPVTSAESVLAIRVPAIVLPDAAGPAPLPGSSAAPRLDTETGRVISAKAEPTGGDSGGARPAAAGSGTTGSGAAVGDALGVERAGDGGSVAGPHALELAGLLHELSVLVLTAEDLAQALERLARFTAAAVRGVLRCSVTLIADGEPLTLAASGPDAQAVDDCQYAIGEGPGLDAVRNRAVVTAQELASDARWPDLADCARAEGVHSVVAIPLDVHRSSVGSLSLFVSRPQGIDPDLLLTAMALVNQAEVLLAELVRREVSSEGAAVDRAVGVIIAQRGCGVSDAYDVLHETALRLGMERRAVAERLLTAAARNAAHP